MATAQQIARPGTDHPAGTPAPQGRARYLRYFLAATVVPLIAWCVAFPLVCSRSYEQWGETQWGPVLEFPYEAGTPNADVVIFGDSSAFLGIDPRLLNAELGIHSVVLPSTVGSLPVIGDTPLRYYLAHHKQPRLIVLYFSTWNLDFNHMAPGRLFEGEEMMLRHGSAAQIAHYELSHPIEFIAFPIRLYSTFGQKMMKGILHHQSRAEDAAAALGHAPYLEPFGPLDAACEIPAAFVGQHGDGTVAQLKQRYQTPGTQVMVYLAPVPACANSGSIRSRSFASLGAAAPAVLPPADFAADPYYTHIRPPEVPVATQVFAAALKARLLQIAPDLLRSAESSIRAGVH